MLWYKCLMKKMSCLNWSCPRPATCPDSSSSRSWRNCWRCSAPTPAAGKWWFAILWRDAYFPWILHVEFDAGHLWRPTWAFWACCLYPFHVLVLSFCMLQQNTAGVRTNLPGRFKRRKAAPITSVSHSSRTALWLLTANFSTRVGWEESVILRIEN